MLCNVISTMDNDGVGNLLYVYKYKKGHGKNTMTLYGDAMELSYYQNINSPRFF